MLIVPNENHVPQGAYPIGFFDFAENLSFGVYQVDKDGKFIYCNEGMARILGVPKKEDLIDRDILDFYLHKEDREGLLENMNGPGKYHELYLNWKAENGRELLLSDSCQFMYDDSKKIVGVCGIVRDVWHRKLFDELNAGIYRIGSNLQTIEMVNPAVAKMFGYQSTREMVGMNVKDLYKDQSKMRKLIDQLEREGMVVNYPIEMMKRTGEEMVISVNATLIKDSQGRVLGREGSFTDITERERIRKILEKMPAGAYQIQIKGDRRIITYCNQAFAILFGYKKAEDLIEKSVDELYAESKDMKAFEDELDRADTENRAIINFRLRVKKKDGEIFKVLIDCHLLKDHKGDIIGRQGTLRDATKEIELEEMVHKKENVQRFVHRFIAPIMSMKSFSEALVEEFESFSSDWLKEIDEIIRRRFEGDPLEIFQVIVSFTQAMIVSLKNVLPKFRGDERMVAVRDILYFFIREIEPQLDIDNIELIVEIRELHYKTRNFFSIYPPEAHLVQPEILTTVREIKQNLDKLDQFYLLYLSQLIFNTGQMAYVDIEKLRSFLMSWSEKETIEAFKLKPENLKKCIREIVNIYQIYAIQKGIKIKLDTVDNLYVKLSRDDFQRMLHYLIENAVKYSFHNGEDIEITVKKEENDIKIYFKNYGVGILDEEIHSGRIFEFGERGKFSNDYNRIGSGIGLSEARYIAKRHNGELSISSKPAHANIDKGNMNQNTPCVTKVLVILPYK